MDMLNFNDKSLLMKNDFELSRWSKYCIIIFYFLIGFEYFPQNKNIIYYIIYNIAIKLIHICYKK